MLIPSGYLDEQVEAGGDLEGLLDPQHGAAVKAQRAGFITAGADGSATWISSLDRIVLLRLILCAWTSRLIGHSEVQRLQSMHLSASACNRSAGRRISNLVRMRRPKISLLAIQPIHSRLAQVRELREPVNGQRRDCRPVAGYSPIAFRSKQRLT